MEYYVTRKGGGPGLLGQVRKLNARNASEEDKKKMQLDFTKKLIDKQKKLAYKALGINEN
jgi:hypothetical protein